jgi:cobalamin biosynthesis protein CobT
MSSKAMGILEKNLDVLKSDIRAFVSDLLVDNSQLDTKEYGQLPHLTCCIIKKADMIWTMPESPKTPLADDDLTDHDADNEPDEDDNNNDCFVSLQPKVEPDSENNETSINENVEGAAEARSESVDEDMNDISYDHDDEDDDESKVFL